MKNILPSIDRRKFIQQSGFIVGGTMLFGSGCQNDSARWLFLTQDEARLVIVMSSRIIPSDDAPGAVEAGVVHFIDQQLVTYYRRWSIVYREGLKGVQNISKALYSKSFEALNPEQMDIIFEKIESETVALELNPGRIVTRFFNLFVDHCMQGFYGDPRHGGNQDWVSYQMLDLRVIDPKSVKLS